MNSYTQGRLHLTAHKKGWSYFYRAALWFWWSNPNPDKPDLMMVDLSLPDMSGIQLTRQILGALPQIKIIIVTMHSKAPLSWFAMPPNSA